MKLARLSGLVAGFTLLALLGGCAPTKSVDYSAFKQAKPRSILVLPPLNESPDVKATYSMLSQVTFPLAEAGYYVVPVALADETFRQNGLTSAGDVHQVSPAKLREIYGADAALYVTVSDYGTRYMVISSATIVTASAKLVDLRSGTTLWTGSATASSEEGNGGNNGGLVGMLITAAVKQIINSSVEDAGYPIAGMTSARLLSAGQPGGLLYGPRSPRYGSDWAVRRGYGDVSVASAQAAGRGLAAALRWPCTGGSGRRATPGWRAARPAAGGRWPRTAGAGLPVAPAARCARRPASRGAPRNVRRWFAAPPATGARPWFRSAATGSR